MPTGGDFLPSTLEQIHLRGWDQADIILITGDAYVDHPAFGVAMIGRWLESLGWRVAILSQPDWRSVDAFRSLGRPRLFWGITSGCIDSRLHSHASLGHRRTEDQYSPGSRIGFRPDRPLLVYAARAREAFREVPIILGGLEASLRRLVHFDYIEDRLKRSVLTDAKADLLVYGMGELAVAQIARRLHAGQSVQNLVDIPGTVYVSGREKPIPSAAITIASLTTLQEHPEQFLDAHRQIERQLFGATAPLIQDQDPGTIVVNPPASPLTDEQLDRLYALPFTRMCDPRYGPEGIPAIKAVQFSITTHRGCFGGCHFCSIACHQGKQIISRSQDSILAEARRLTAHPQFAGTISDLGGPTANMYGMRCGCKEPCSRNSCLFPKPCRHLNADDSKLLSLMEAIIREFQTGKRKINCFVASGIRHDLALDHDEYLRLLTRYFVGGHLKVAPEHSCNSVLDLMGKPPFELFAQFEDQFRKANLRAGKQQYLVPYFISGHPGCTADDALKLTEYLVSKKWRLQQVQDFVPIPLTASTAMFVSGRNLTGRTIFIPRGAGEKTLQMALLHYHQPKNLRTIAAYLQRRGKDDLLARIRKLQVPHRRKT